MRDRIVRPGFAILVDDGQQIFGLGIDINIQIDVLSHQIGRINFGVVQLVDRFVGQTMDLFLTYRRVVFKFVQ